MSELLIAESSDGHFSLTGELNRNSIPKASGLALISKNTALDGTTTLDLAAVTHVDTAGLAWLINVLKEGRAQNVQFQLRHIPQTLLNLAKISDVDSFLSVQ